MDMIWPNYYFTIVINISVFTLAIFLIISKLTKKSLNLINNLPPGPRKLPLIGNFHHLLGEKPPHHILRDLAKRYGPLMHLQLGEISTIVVSSPEIAKQVLNTHDVTFAYRPSLLAPEILAYGNTDIGFAPYGEYWRQLRKICTLELLSKKRVQSFRPIREEEFANTCRWVTSQIPSAINLTEQIIKANYDTMSLSTLGKKTSKDQALFISLVQKIIEVSSGFNIVDLYPSIKLLGLLTGFRKRIRRLHQETDRILGNLIDEHNQLLNNDSKINKEDDLLDVLLKLQESGLDLPLTTDNIKAVLLDMFIAGIETSATTTDWAMSELLKNPRVLKKSQEEVRQVFDGRSYVVDESYIGELEYLKLIIKETLRIHPPLPLLIPRECNESCNIDGYEIPVKSRVLVNAWAINRDPRYWEDAETFKPERFAENSFDFKGNDFKYIPFGAGRRICPGGSFGLANVELLLAMFLYHFDWILPGQMEPQELDMTETFGATTRRKNDLFVIPIVRRAFPIE